MVEPTPSEKIWVKMGSSSPIFGVKIKNLWNHHLVYAYEKKSQQKWSGRSPNHSYNPFRWGDVASKIQGLPSSPETTLKNRRNPTSPRDNTCQSLGLIFPFNKVLMVDPEIVVASTEFFWQVSSHSLVFSPETCSKRQPFIHQWHTCFSEILIGLWGSWNGLFQIPM